MEVKRIPPCPDYDIRGTEKWLEDMALKGYILCEGHAFQYGFAYFETGEPRRIRYRITPAKKVPKTIASPNNSPEPPDEEALNFHSQFGWKYTTYRGQFWIFRCEDPNAPEMNTDPQVQAIALKVAEKRLREHFFWLMMYGLIIMPERSLLYLCSNLVEHGFRGYWPMPIFLILVCIAWLPGLLHIIRFRKELKQGRFPEKTTYLSPAKAHAQFISRFLPFLWLIICIWIAPSYITRNGDTLTPETAEALPYVTVADLFPEAEVEYIGYSTIYLWETDASVWTDVSEHFRLTFPDGTTVTGIWELNRYDTAYDWIAAGFARETRFRYWLRGGTQNLDAALPEADWFRAFHVDNPDRYQFAHDVILLQEGNVMQEAWLMLSSDVPDGYTLEELGAFLIAHEHDGKGGIEQ